MEVTEQAVFAVIGRLTVENAALTQENARLKAELAQAKGAALLNGAGIDSVGDEAAARES